MNIAEFSIRKSVITWLLVILCVVGGLYAYQNLARYEDPEFTIKDAMVLTAYKGATPKEVEEEVTDRIEMAIQQMAQIKRVTSISRYGMSEITVTIKDKYDKKSLPQVWDELRRKVMDVQRDLPPGAGPSLVYDDYGDVFGMLYAITGDGFSYQSIKDYSKIIKRELSLVPNVAKVEITGEQQSVIYLDISRSRMAQLGISLNQVYKLLESQNIVAYAGEARVGDEYINIIPTGNIDSVAAISNLLIRSNTSKRFLNLSDIATIYRGYKEVPSHLVYFNGHPALMMGISIVSGGNVVKIGAAVKKRMQELEAQIPVGINVNPVYQQPQIVQQSINGFIISLLEALAIVVVVLLIFMGVRCGIIISSVLLLTVLGTLFVMLLFNIALERISLGALIIALGMLVDNAIVVAEGILIKVQQGVEKITAAKDTVSKTMWPLFGATVVGVLAFAAIGLSQDSTGEYARSLFYVILFSLMLSWVLAITVTPLFCYLLLKKGKKAVEDPYKGGFYRGYKAFLAFCLRTRYAVVVIMIALLAASIYGFGYVKQSFFPDSTTPMFFIDYWRSQGTDIRVTAADLQKIENHIKKMDEVVTVTSVVGSGAQRFMLVYEPEKTNSSYGQLLIRVKDYKTIPRVANEIKQYIVSTYPDTEPKIKYIRLGPGKGSKIEARFSGPDEKVLRRLSNEAQDIMHKTPGAVDIRDDWRQPVKVIEPVYSESQARLTGITRKIMNDALQTAFSGMQVGLYREGDELIPIISRAPDKERLDIENLDDLQIWSPLLQKTVPMGQIVSGVKTVWQNGIIRRRNRRMTVTTSCEPESGPASVVLNRMKDKIAAIKLPTGYEFEWGGEYENSHDAQVGLAKQMPLSVISMVLVVILLFSAIRQPLIIWLCVPLSFIGVTAGLLLTRLEFGFMALLGFLSLSGMLIKNAIVLVDQIDLEIAEGKNPYQAILDSAVSRMRPVVLAAMTTVLGMIPLLPDAFFVSMAVVIMFGLTFATILTLIIVPVLYAIFFRAHRPKAPDPS